MKNNEIKLKSHDRKMRLLIKFTDYSSSIMFEWSFNQGEIKMRHMAS